MYRQDSGEDDEMRISLLRTLLRSARGTTLIELLIAIVILAVGVLGAVALFPQAYKGVTRSGRISTINHLGYQKIDELRTKAFQNWGHADLTDGGHPATAAARMVGTTFPDYSITWIVDDDAWTAETGNMKTITVEVGYLLYDSSGNAITHKQAISKKFQTFVAE